MLDRAKLEEALAALPIFQYAYFSPADLVFTERVRHVCETECPMYGKTWACPPAVGTVEECRARCLSYPEGLMISTVTEVGDVENLEETLSTRKEHEEITHQVAKLVAALKGRVLLSAGSRPYLSVKLAGKEPLEGLSEVLRAMEAARSPAA